MGSSFGVMRWKVNNNIPNATKLSTLKWILLYYMDLISINYFPPKPPHSSSDSSPSNWQLTAGARGTLLQMIVMLGGGEGGLEHRVHSNHYSDNRYHWFSLAMKPLPPLTASPVHSRASHTLSPIPSKGTFT